MASIWICSPFHSNRISYESGRSGLVQKSNQLRRIYLASEEEVTLWIFEVAIMSNVTYFG